MLAKNVGISSVLFAFLLSGALSVASAKDETVILVPRRPAIAGIALDMAKMRYDVSVVLYQVVPKTSVLVLHAWDGRTEKWVKITADEYSSGQVFPRAPKQTILIGTDSELMATVERLSAWGKVTRIQTLNILDVINSLNESFTFSTSEWRYLAKMYDLKLRDLNEERRRYGRYGKPGEEPVMPKEVEVKTSTVVLPTAAPVTTKTAEPATAPEDK